MRKQTFAQWADNVVTAVCMVAAGLAAYRSEWDAGIFWVLCAILTQLPPRSLWRK